MNTIILGSNRVRNISKDKMNDHEGGGAFRKTGIP